MKLLSNLVFINFNNLGALALIGELRHLSPVSAYGTRGITRANCDNSKGWVITLKYIPGKWALFLIPFYVLDLIQP